MDKIWAKFNFWPWPPVARYLQTLSIFVCLTRPPDHMLTRARPNLRHPCFTLFERIKITCRTNLFQLFYKSCSRIEIWNWLRNGEQLSILGIEHVSRSYPHHTVQNSYQVKLINWCLLIDSISSLFLLKKDSRLRWISNSFGLFHCSHC